MREWKSKGGRIVFVVRQSLRLGEEKDRRLKLLVNHEARIEWK